MDYLVMGSYLLDKNEQNQKVAPLEKGYLELD
jgi:hypothetical protein